MNIFNSLVTYKDSVYHADGIRCWSNKQIIIKAKRKKTAEELYCEHFASKEYYYINALMRLEITLRKLFTGSIHSKQKIYLTRKVIIILSLRQSTLISV